MIHVLKIGLVLASVWRRATRGYFVHRKAKVEAADGSRSRPDILSLVISFHGGA